jgi:GTP-binding protein
LDDMASRIARRPAAHPDILPTSGRTGQGMPELRAAIARLRHERQPA